MHLLSVFSLRNRALIALVTVVVAIFGGIALSNLKQELIPSVEFPQVAIVSAYPGATPEVVSNDVSTKIEQAIQVVPDLESTSATSSTGQSVVSASFQYGSNLASAEDKIQTAVNALSLPDSVQTQIVTGSFDDLPVLQVAVSASGNQEQLVDRLQASAIPDLEKLDGVRQADVFGNPGRRVVITPDQDELAARGLTQTAISDALDDNGTLIPGGTITEDGSTLSVQTGERIASLKDIRALPLTSSSSSSSSSGSDGSGSGAAGADGTASSGDGTAAGATGTGATAAAPTGDAATDTSTTAATPTDTTLGDVAKVAITESPRTSISRVDGQQALTISITKTQEANTVDVSNTVRDALPGIEDKIEGDPSFTVVFDQAPYIQQSIDSLAEEGLLGLAFAVIVILVFLLSWRSTLVTAISIPTSVLLAAIGMRAAGYTLNIITLAALTIAIGRVVDDSIVVIENIKRHMQPGVDRGQAVRDAVREVAGAVTASTLTTVAVFLPVAFVAELVGELFRPFAVTVTLALVASLFVSLTIVPVLAYWWLRPPKAQAGRRDDGSGSAHGRGSGTVGDRCRARARGRPLGGCARLRGGSARRRPGGPSAPRLPAGAPVGRPEAGRRHPPRRDRARRNGRHAAVRHHELPRRLGAEHVHGHAGPEGRFEPRRPVRVRTQGRAGTAGRRRRRDRADHHRHERPVDPGGVRRGRQRLGAVRRDDRRRGRPADDPGRRPEVDRRRSRTSARSPSRPPAAGSVAAATSRSTSPRRPSRSSRRRRARC